MRFRAADTAISRLENKYDARHKYVYTGFHGARRQQESGHPRANPRGGGACHSTQRIRGRRRGRGHEGSGPDAWRLLRAFRVPRGDAGRGTGARRGGRRHVARQARRGAPDTGSNSLASHRRGVSVGGAPGRHRARVPGGGACIRNAAAIAGIARSFGATRRNLWSRPFAARCPNPGARNRQWRLPARWSGRCSLRAC